MCTGKPCDVTTTTPAPNDNTVKCQSGWTPWLNQDKPKNRKENKKGRKLDIEPLPSALLLNSLPAGIYIYIDFQVEILNVPVFFSVFQGVVAVIPDKCMKSNVEPLKVT